MISFLLVFVRVGCHNPKSGIGNGSQYARKKCPEKIVLHQESLEKCAYKKKKVNFAVTGLRILNLLIHYISDTLIKVIVCCLKKKWVQLSNISIWQVKDKSMNLKCSHAFFHKR